MNNTILGPHNGQPLRPWRDYIFACIPTLGVVGLACVLMSDVLKAYYQACDHISMAAFVGLVVVSAIVFAIAAAVIFGVTLRFRLNRNSVEAQVGEPRREQDEKAEEKEETPTH